MFLAQSLGPSFGVADWTVPAVALAVFVGHLFPVFHGFAGGKGVATAAGIVFALYWPLGLALAALWMIMALGIQDQLARGAHHGDARTGRRVLRVRQLADGVGDGRDLRCSSSGGTSRTSGSCSQGSERTIGR